MPRSPKVRQGAPYNKILGSLGRAQARRLYGLQAFIGVTQQTINSYETGRRRVPVSLLAAIARRLGISIEELVGEPAKSSKRGPTPKLQQQMERIAQLPRARQQFVMQVIESVLAQRP
ncbi:MAG: helix-turn-helix domain-containing protein [Lysobacter sp.]|nr:helix-turn-helix domain-containing protein [Lysobacter sp.]